MDSSSNSSASGRRSWIGVFCLILVAFLLCAAGILVHGSAIGNAPRVPSPEEAELWWRLQQRQQQSRGTPPGDRHRKNGQGTSLDSEWVEEQQEQWRSENDSSSSAGYQRAPGVSALSNASRSSLPEVGLLRQLHSSDASPEAFHKQQHQHQQGIGGNESSGPEHRSSRTELIRQAPAGAAAGVGKMKPHQLLGSGYHQPDALPDVKVPSVEWLYHCRFCTMLAQQLVYSKPTMPRKFALVIEMNDLVVPGELAFSCTVDVEKMLVTLAHSFGYPRSSVSRLINPSIEKFLRALEAVASQAKAGDMLFLYFCGHGGSVTPAKLRKVKQSMRVDGVHGFKDREEIDGKDELIQLANGLLLDDLLHQVIVVEMVEKLGVEVRGVFETCHAGSLLDLPLELHGNSWRRSSLRQPGVPVPVMFPNEAQGNAISISACQDSETTPYDEELMYGEFTDALTTAILKGAVTYGDLLRALRDNPNLESSPVLSSLQAFNVSKPLDF